MNSVLITGGTGSFGRAFTKLLLKKTKFDRIVIYSRDEHKQEQMAAEFNSDRLRFFIGDVRDKDRLKLAVQDCIYIVHAAALKVVPAGEYNPQEFIKTNIIGAQNLIDCLVGTTTRQYARVIALSTDKAVNPINLYGATKLCMEKLFIASNALVGERDISFNIVRYGNVANSAGSVIPKFKKAWLRNEPFPVTDVSMTRYWITLEDAAKFVWDCLGKTGKGKVFIPNMPSFKITELAKAFPRNEGELMEIIGIRPGEKLHEQIDHDKYSNTNEKFLTWQELRERLISLGVLAT